MAPHDESPPLRRTASTYLRRVAGSRLSPTRPVPLLQGFPKPAVELAARAWTLRAEEEYRSASVFAEIVAGLLDTGAPFDLVAAFGSVVGDELAHSALCFDFAVAMGAPLPRASMERVRQRLDPSGGRRLTALKLILFEGAIGETISCKLFHAGVAGSREPATRAHLRVILKDEARHAKLCWHAAGELLQESTEGDRVGVEEALPGFLGEIEWSLALPALRRLERGEEFPHELIELGLLPATARVESFYSSIEKLVLPRLNRIGLDAKRAWANRYRVAE